MAECTSNSCKQFENRNSKMTSPNKTKEATLKRGSVLRAIIHMWDGLCKKRHCVMSVSICNALLTYMSNLITEV